MTVSFIMNMFLKKKSCTELIYRALIKKTDFELDKEFIDIKNSSLS